MSGYVIASIQERKMEDTCNRLVLIRHILRTPDAVHTRAGEVDAHDGAMTCWKDVGSVSETARYCIAYGPPMAFIRVLLLTFCSARPKHIALLVRLLGTLLGEDIVQLFDSCDIRSFLSTTSRAP